MHLASPSLSTFEVLVVQTPGLNPYNIWSHGHPDRMFRFSSTRPGSSIATPNLIFVEKWKKNPDMLSDKQNYLIMVEPF